jgi:membrane associated rhomboid family serine protease
MKTGAAINLPPIILWLALVLAGVHGLRNLVSAEADGWILLTFAFVPLRYGELAGILPGGAGASLWSPVTYAFLHADLVHLIVNVVWMASFGGALARRFGPVRFLLLSLISAVAGAALHYVLHASEEGIMIGASGAVSGMMAGTVRFAFAPGGPLRGNRSAGAYRVPAEPLTAVFARSRALGFILVWFAVNFLFGVADGLIPGSSGPIAWEAHIGGFVAGLLCFSLLDPVPPTPLAEDDVAS